MLNTISHNQHRMIIQTVLVLLLLLFGLAGVHLAVAQRQSRPQALKSIQI